MLGDREEQLRRLADERFDVAVVGGGITGAGVALDLSARGLRVGLVERSDFASGTSSRSSKLVHGGLRYLAQLQLSVTRESLRERQTLLRLAPALVEPLPFVISVSRGLFEAARVAVGLTLYDALAGTLALDHWALLRRVDLKALAPGIDTSRLTVAYVYHDCRTDDARLTLSVLARAHELGAVVANHAEATDVLHQHGRAVGVRVRDRVGGAELDVRARCVVVATGAWGDGALVGDGVEAVARVRPAKGVHLFLPQERLQTRVALYLPTGVDDRLVFVVPWHGRVLVGTTDTDYDGPLDRPRAEPADVDYLLGVLNRAFPGKLFSRADVVGAQAGLRPLVRTEGPTSKASREERVWQRSDGAIVVAGGKLTTFRAMAEKVARYVVPHVGGGAGSPAEHALIAPRVDPTPIERRLVPLGVTPATVAHLVQTYGASASVVAALVEADRSLTEPIVPGQPPIIAEVVHGARSEQARTVADVLARRTRLLLVDHRGAIAAAPRVVAAVWPAGMARDHVEAI
jgi:glycerol-3-phosphate dehydrogenase